jgi:hypothetical protein
LLAFVTGSPVNLTWIPEAAVGRIGSQQLPRGVDMPKAIKVGPEFLVNTQVSGSQKYAEVSRLLNGNFIVIWQDGDGYNTDGTLVDSSIKVQIFNPDGSKIGTEVRVETQTANRQSSPSIVGLTNGGFVATWTDESGSSSVKAQVFGSDGSKVGGEFLVNFQTAQIQAFPTIASLTNGGFVVAWMDQSGTLGDASDWSIKAQVFASDGTEVGGEFLVNTQTSNGQFSPSVTGLPNGGFVVSWRDASGTLGDASGSSIKAQLFAADGGKVGSEFLVNTETADNQSAPTITGLANGNFVVSWTDSSTISLFASYSIKAQIVAANGNKLGSEILVSKSGVLGGASTISGLSNGGFIVSWTGGNANRQAVKAQLFDSEGSKIEGEILVSTPGSDQQMPTVIGLDNGNFVVSWWNSPPGTDNVRAQIFAINQDPVISSDGGGATAAISIVENSRDVTRVTATDVDSGTTLTYSILGGADAGLFQINATTGALSFKTAPNFEVPTDGGANNVYDVVVQASDGSLTDTQAIAVRVSDVNAALVISSNGGGATAAISIVENVKAVTTVTTTGFDAGTMLTYSILGGSDAALFQINSETGALSFKTAPNFEVPTDAGANNVYDVVVQVSDGSLTDTQAVAVTVSDVDEIAPTVSTIIYGTNDGALGLGEAVALTVTLTEAVNVTGTPTLALANGGTASYTGGTGTSALTFSYTAAAGQTTADLATAASNALTGTIRDLAGNAVTAAGFNNVNPTGTLAVSAADPKIEFGYLTLVDGIFSNGQISNAIYEWRISDQLVMAEGDFQQFRYYFSGKVPGDQVEISFSSYQEVFGNTKNSSDFIILSQSDILNGYIEYFFYPILDFQTESDADIKIYFDQFHIDLKMLDNSKSNNSVISLIHHGDFDGVFDRSIWKDRTVTESEYVQITLHSRISGSANYTITGSTSIDDISNWGALSGNLFIGGRVTTSFRILNDNVSERDESFIFKIQQSENYFTIQDMRSPPVVTSNGGSATAALSVAENVTAVTTVTATDPDANTSLTYSISGGADAALFQMNGSTGALSFKGAPNFESPNDAGGNNVYDIIVQVSDGNLTDTQAIAVTVTNINEAPSGALRILSQVEQTFTQPTNEFRVNTYTASFQDEPSVTALADGGWLVTWQSFGQDGPECLGVYGQRYNIAGSTVGSEFLVNTYTINHQKDPSVTALADGGWLVTWTSIGQDGSISGVYGQRYNSAGSTVGSEFRVNTYTISEKYAPSVTALSDGGWLVTWTSVDQDGSFWGVYGQRYNSAGSTVGSEFRVNTYTTNSQELPSVTALADGGWLVTWQSSGQDGSGLGVYGQRYNSAGSNVGSEFPVNTYTAGSQYAPSVTALADGGWLVTWTSGGQDGLGSGVYGQRYNSAGSTVGSEFLVNTYTTSFQDEPSVTALADGGWLVTWQSNAQDGSGLGVYGQRYNSAGFTVGSEFLVNTYIISNQVYPSVTALADGGWLVTWQSNGQDGSGAGVYGQRYDAAGNKAYTYLAPAVVAAVSDFAENKVLFADASQVTDPDGVGTVGWQWQRSGDGGVTWVDISGATLHSYTLGDSDAGKLVRTKGIYTDGQGATETVYSAASTQVINVNDAPIGFGVSISGSATEDATLTASASVVSDADGLPNPLSFTYQWQSSSNGSTWTNISGATAANFTPGDAHVGKQLRSVATYTDSQGTTETATSAATAAIANVNDAPVVSAAIADQAIAENTAWSYQVASGTFSDVDGDTLTYSATLGDGASLPGWLSFNAGTRTFSGTPPQNFAGTLNLKVTASDGSANVSDTFILTVAALDVVTGTSANDTLTGASRRISQFTGGAGNDTLTGGSRADVAVYTGNRSDYTVTTVAGVTTVRDNRAGSPDGTDTLRGLNILRFADMQLFQSTAANKMTLAGQAQTFHVSNSEMVQGTNAVEHFIVAPKTSALVFVGNGDTVDLAGSMSSYSFSKTGTQLQISDGTYTTTLSVGGSFTLRTASGSTSVDIDFTAGGVIKLGGTQIVGSSTFDPMAAITLANNTSEQARSSPTAPPTVDILRTTDKTPTLSGTATLSAGQVPEVRVGGTTYTTATGLSLGANGTWSLTLPTDLPQGTYDVALRIVSAPVLAATAVTGTSGNDTLAGVAGSVSQFTGGAGNDTLTGGSRADVAVYTGNRGDYTVTTVAGVTTVRDNRAGSPDGTDTLRGLNILRFADMQLFQSTAANKMTLAGQAQTFHVSNSEMVQGTNAVEHFIVAPKTSALIFVGNGDTVDLAGSMSSYSFSKTGTQLQISDGTYTTTLSVGGSFTLRTASGSTSVAIDFTAGGAIKLGGTQIVGSSTFDPMAAIANANNTSDNAAFPVNDTTSAELTILGFVISGDTNVSEGRSFTLTIDAEGVADGTVVPYTLSGTGITSGDIAGGLSGSFTVNNGRGSITVTTALDRLTEGTEQLLVTLGGTAAGTPAFTVSIADIGLTPVVVANGQSYTATAGKVDTFIIDASQSLAATIVGFEAGDVLEFTGHSQELGVNFENLTFSDGLTTISAGNASITLSGLANDNFGDEASFEAIYGANAVGYVMP